MGTDITLFAEHRVNGRWQLPEGEQEPLACSRNYALFGVLAGVWDTQVPYITKPRGPPDDVSMVIAERYADFGHSASWLSLERLMDYNWMREIYRSGVVSMYGLATHVAHGRPTCYSASVGGPGVSIYDAGLGLAILRELAERENRPMEDFAWEAAASGLTFGGDTPLGLAEKLAAERLDCRHPYFRLDWHETVNTLCSEFLSEIMPRLWRLGSPQDVRIVFYFD